MMIVQEILQRVERHYATPGVGPLMLSSLGQDLRKHGLWPIENDKRSLAAFLSEEIGAVVLRSDPTATAYVVVVPKGQEALADKAFERRRGQQLLKRLPRALLLAFCVDTNAPVSVRLNPAPLRYVVGDLPDEVGEWAAVEANFRTPGLFVPEDRGLPVADADLLLAHLTAWADLHAVDLFELASRPAREVAPPAVPELAANALERLYAAQAEALRDKLVVPVDIALLLSRQP
ncbi:hypothetical protein [Brevundimonas sp. ZS04]|uniref:hypothetical protein n=1 Tax=Brevundimonas sp. ZS04 TaxID=1906854 RepID=UPI00096DBBB6|nr:hypothetical protein [Brevundimonas sp. ZS04]OMG60080.1 hypothetical protein BJP32_06235 [Brevundimonas sp. ZS04]